MRNYFICAISLAAILFAVLSAMTTAQADELSDLKKKVDRQQQEINELRQGLEKLGQGGEPITMKPMFGANLGLFGDINFTTNSREKTKNSFYLGETDLYSTGRYGERLTFLSEIAIENEERGFEIDVERLWVGYAFSDLLVIRAGKQHTAMGYWNKTYHHGKQLFLTVDRPFFLAFEHDGGVIPTHIVGLEFEGRWGYDFARFKYEFEIGNGPHIDQSSRELMPNNFHDDNNSKQIVLRLSAAPHAYPNLNLGVFGTLFTVDTRSRPDIEEMIFGVDIAYNYHGLEFLAEYFILDNRDALSRAFYAQLGYSVTENVTPYVRVENLNKDRNDPYLSDLRNGFDRRQVIAGIKYDIDVVKSSIKAQYRYDDTIGGKDYNVFELQWSFGF